MSMPLVSIIIPCYNAELYIQVTIESALKQAYENTEIIVIDDGSTDNTFELAGRYRDRGIIILHQENKGGSAARNKGIEAATGEWLQFLDADDILHPQKIELQMQRAERDGPDYIYSGDWRRFTKDISDSWVAPSELLVDAKPVEWLVKKYSLHDMIQPGAWLTSRSLIERSGQWNELLSLNDDGEFFDRVILKSAGIKYVAGAEIFYRSAVKNSVSAQVTRRAAESGLLAINLCTERLIAAKDSAETRKACSIQYQLFAYQFYPYFEDLAEKSIQESLQLSGWRVDLPGGKKLKYLTHLVGWRKARMLQYWYYEIRYKKTTRT
jgi:glycosyltransferase involved in cell wall biosynthesis